MTSNGRFVCLLTDFGLKDAYVGVLKGVLYREAPGLQVIDLTHEIPPQNVKAAAFALATSYRFFPKGTLFLCVVDPEVGSARPILWAEAGGWRFIAPDNGLLSWVFKDLPPSRLFDISKGMGDPNRLGRTFHARDVMAPIAARILRGRSPASFGRPVSSYVSLPFPPVVKRPDQWRGEVLACDTFGNLITNFRSGEVEGIARRAEVRFGFKRGKSHIMGLSASYSSVREKAVLAIRGSSGYIEMSARNGHLADKLGMREGEPVVMYIKNRINQ